MYYTYILESIDYPGHRYIGHTSNLRSRLEEHNAGKCVYTKKFRPWKLKIYIAFDEEKPALNFEKYLKTGSGHAFAKRHFWNVR